MSAYGRLNSEFPERILRLTEGEAEHRRKQDERWNSALINNLKAQQSERKRGQIFALIVSISFLVGGSVLALLGQPIVGGIALGGTLVAPVTVFVTGKVGKSTKHDAEPDRSHDSDRPGTSQ
jgi:uncharacterized membrane protein